jgi:hypothetical protein
MPVQNAASHLPQSRRLFNHTVLLAGTSALALMLAMPGAHALQPGRTGSASSATVNAATSAIVSAQQAAAATQQSMQSLTRATQAIQAMQAVQNAARNAALAGANSLGADPNHRGLQLPNVPNGLSAGGLQVAPGVGTDPSLWQNAKLQRRQGHHALFQSERRHRRERQQWLGRAQPRHRPVRSTEPDPRSD